MSGLRISMPCFAIGGQYQTDACRRQLPPPILDGAALAARIVQRVNQLRAFPIAGMAGFWVTGLVLVLVYPCGVQESGVVVRVVILNGSPA
jgi:hypothetical protein